MERKESVRGTSKRKRNHHGFNRSSALKMICKVWLREQMERTSGLRIIRSIFPDQLSVSYVPTVFRANNPRSQADVGVFKSGPLIPDYTQAKNQRNIYMPVDVNIDEPIIEEDPISSSDESPNSPSREGRDKRVLVPSGAPRSADETSTGYGPECKWL
ncbi:hypothetical protein PVAP13_4NG096900 [Panicum virgatum]|uniref:Uncharacterized protein n=1 Tax=Panicum virgatum TaxID=38727 RepID=A0A8T0T8R4_PANVG|nr:hypothetical protein PVAP13_4NG096900 [Panicum virgatum]